MKNTVVILLLAQSILTSAAVANPAIDDGAALRALFRSSDFKLSEAPSCHGVGLTPADETLGDFIGSILSQFVGTTLDSASLEVRRAASAQLHRIWTEVTFHKKFEEEEWRWGVAFLLDERSGKVVPGSIRCIVAG